MYHYFNNLQSPRGDALSGYRVRVIDTANAIVPIFADENGTPIEVVSGIESMAVTDAAGNYDFFVEDGTYNLEFLSPAGSLLGRLRFVVMERGPQGQQGEPGPAKNIAVDLGGLKASDIENTSMFYDGATFTFTGGDYTGLADDINTIASNNAPLSTGAWVRQGADKLVARSPLPGAVTLTQAQVNAETISVLRFGADPTGALDSTAAFNLATSAASAPYTGNANAILRNIRVPNGRYKINGTVYVRRGQSLIGESYSGVVIDCQNNPGTVFKMGQAASGVDQGGYGVTIQNILTYGGASTAPVFDASTPDSWKIISCMITEPGIGIRAGGTDGKIIDCIIDGGLTGIEFIATAPYKCHGIICSLNKFFNPVNAIRVRDGAADLLVTGNLIQFSEVASVEMTGANIRNIQITNNQIIANGQFEGHLGGVFINNCPNADAVVTNNVFRNLKGQALAYGGGLGIKLIFAGNTIDGARSEPSYDQSTTAGGLEVSNMDAVVSGNIFKNLPGPVIFCAPSSATTVRISGNAFSGNTGGATELQLSGVNGASSVMVDPSNFSDRAIIPAQTGIPVLARNAARGRATLTGGQVVVSAPLTRTSSRVLVQRYDDGGTVGASYSVIRSPGTGFTITSRNGAGATQAADTSTVDWVMDLEGA